MLQHILSRLFWVIVVFSIPYWVFGEGFAESAALGTRNRYHANRGIIVPSEEIDADRYIAAFDYQYPNPETEGVGVYLYNRFTRMTDQGQEGILQIGLQGQTRPFAELPPLNLVFVIDTSHSMAEADKIAWIQEALGSFVNKIRNGDSLGLIGFNDTPQVLFPSTLMNSPQKRQGFRDAIQTLVPQGGTKLEPGLALASEEALVNYQKGGVNLVFLLTDGTELSARLAKAQAHSGDIGISLIWYNRDDLDLHVVNPLGEELYYDKKKDSTGGILDVDRNVTGETTKPVENVFWYRGTPGQYRVYVQNYDYHELARTPIPFEVWIKNDKEYLNFEGTVSGSGSGSNTEICTFEFRDTGTPVPQYQPLKTYREQGITLSTLGVGSDFDEEFLRLLAEQGQGSSRSLGNRELIQETFDTDRAFERIAVPAAQDMKLALEFMPGIEILGAWGCPHQIENNRIMYQVPTLFQGDYKTLVVHYRIPPQMAENDSQLASFQVHAQDQAGKPFEKTLHVSPSDPADAQTDRMLRYSEAMVQFAEALKEIGDTYYAAENEPSRLQIALQRARETDIALAKVKKELQDSAAFTQELALLTRYYALLIEKLPPDQRGPAVETLSRMSAENETTSRMSSEAAPVSRMSTER
ncbi:MAG: VWA domain-containing protein [Treponema sp.]|jgi:Ca-activated chloride channel family protein|nr:VWA domain-containing protein [Treponema sp.]